MASSNVAYNFPNAQWPEDVYVPVSDESGKIIPWYVEATDIDEQQEAQERLLSQNLVLREEIDQSSMFE